MRRIRGWWMSQNQTTRQILLVLILVALISSMAGVVLTNGDVGGLLLNFGTEMGGAVVTFVLITQIVGGAEEQERLKRDLIVRLGSRVNNTALSAVDELAAQGWQRDGSLKEANLHSANLQGVVMEMANLEEAVLIAANLRGAYLQSTNLKGAYLMVADLQGADLSAANLQGANLTYVNLQEANLQLANLERADLIRANFNENTKLPDGSLWTPDTDMGHFTDPTHDHFWRPSPGSTWWYPPMEMQYDHE